MVFDVELYSVDQGPRVPTPEDVQAPPETAERTASGIASRVLKPGVGKQTPGKAGGLTHFVGVLGGFALEVLSISECLESFFRLFPGFLVFYFGLPLGLSFQEEC